MKIAYGSDFHMEHYRGRPQYENPILDEKVDVLVAAGDIQAGAKAPSFLRKEYGKLAQQIIYVPGNHEYYGGHIPTVKSEIQDECVANDIILIGDACNALIHDVMFWGDTLWTDFELGGNKLDAMFASQTYMNDFRLIRVGDITKQRPLIPEDTVEMHEMQLERIKHLSMMAHPTTKKVIVTHHGPSKQSIHERYSNDIMNAAFNSELDLESGWGPDLWIHGHVHDPFDYTIGRTRVVTNPRGYPGEKYGPRDYELKIIEL